MPDLLLLSPLIAFPKSILFASLMILIAHSLLIAMVQDIKCFASVYSDNCSSARLGGSPVLTAFAQEVHYNLHADTEMYAKAEAGSTNYKMIGFGNIDALIIKLFVKDVAKDELQDHIFHLFLTCTLAESQVDVFCQSRSVEQNQCLVLKEHLSRLLLEYQDSYFSDLQRANCRTIGRPFASGLPNPGFNMNTNDVLLEVDHAVYVVPAPIGVSIINPSIVNWNGKILISTRTAVFGTSSKITSDVISFTLFKDIDAFENWIKGNMRGLDLKSHYTVEIGSGIGLGSRSYVTGEDARFVVVGGDKLYVVFNSINAVYYPSRLMFYAQVEITPDGSRAVVVGKIAAMDANLFTGFSGQKNWSPFDYNGKLAFSYSLFPHVVIEPVDHISSLQDFSICESALEQYDEYHNVNTLIPETLLLRECYHKRISLSLNTAPKTVRVVAVSERFSGSLQYLTSYMDLVENYLIFYEQIHEPMVVDDVRTLRYQNFSLDVGFISGGSPSVKINSTHYLGFFHSRFFDYKINKLRYAMGAYLFLATPPFRMVALMNAPMLPAVIKRALSESSPIDNVYYPAGLLLEGVDNGDGNGSGRIWLSLGHDDQRGLVTRYSLRELLNHMEILT